MLSNGTSGDVNNIDFRQKNPKRYERYEKMQEVANKVADRVYEAHGKIQFRNSARLAAELQPLTLKVRKPSKEMLAYFAKAASDENKSSRHRREAIYADRIERLKDAPDTVDVPIQTLRIGDLAIAAIPFETFAETGLEIKAKSPFKSTFTIELANGSYGYLPTPSQHRLGGYETWLGTNYVQKDASERIVDDLLKMFQSLQP